MAQLAVSEGPDRLDAFALNLEKGALDLSADTADLQEALGLGHARLQPYRTVLRHSASLEELIGVVRAAASTARACAASQPRVEVAWTYPASSRHGLRTTGGVARELISGSSNTLLVVGYSVTIDPGLTGLAALTLAAIAQAAQRGVATTIVLHSDANLSAMFRQWASGVPRPTVYTWPESSDPMAAIHAKLLVVDRRDALVTSANLTYHGFERNLEMGVRVTGTAAAEMSDQIHALIADGELIPWPN